MVFVPHHLAYFTCMMLSSSIHAVAKGRSSFFHKWFWQWKKHLSVGIIASNAKYFESDWSLTCKNKYTIFINKFHFGGCPLYEQAVSLFLWESNISVYVKWWLHVATSHDKLLISSRSMKAETHPGHDSGRGHSSKTVEDLLTWMACT